MSDQRKEKRENEGSDYTYERRTDLAANMAAMTQKLDDHIEQNARDFESLKQDLKPIFKFYNRVNWPVTALGWILVTLAAGVLAAVGTGVYELVVKLGKLIRSN